MYKYIQETEKSDWIPIRSSELPSRMGELNPKKITVLEVSELVEGGRSNASYAYKGPLYFDIDCKEDLGLAAESCLSLCNKLMELGLPKLGLQIYVSGSKGFHVLVDQKFFNSGRPIKALPLIYKEMALKLYVPGLDFQVYSCGKGVCWRVENVERDDGNYRVPIVYEELQSMTVPIYQDLASRPREVTPIRAHPEKLPQLVTLFDDARKVVSAPTPPIIELGEENLKAIKEELPPCVEALCKYSGVRAEKNFNQVALQVGVYLAKSGASESQADTVMSLLAENGKSSQYSTLRARRDHARGQYSYAKTSRYTFGCNAMRGLLERSPCSGCPIEDSCESSASTSATAGLIERDDGYYILGAKEDRVLSNFVFTPTDVYMEIPHTGERPRRIGVRMDITQDKESITSLVFDESSWASRTGLIREVEGYSNLVFYGSDHDTQKIKQHVMAQDYDMGEIYKVYTCGILSSKVSHSEVFTYVEPGMSINSNRVQGTHEFSGSMVASPYFVESEVCAKGDEEADEALLNLMKMNGTLEMAKIIGWCVACHFKAQYMSAFNQFPILSVWGGADSGKSVTTALVTWLNGTDYSSRDTAVNVANITPYAMVHYAASSTTIPRILEEYNKSKMANATYNLVGEIVKAGWNGERILRGALGGRKKSDGRTGAVVNEIPISGPMIVISEQEIDSPALQHRTVRVMLSAESRQGKRENLRAASAGRESIRKVGKAIMATALQTSSSEILELMRSIEDKITGDLSDRARFGQETCWAGLQLLKRIVENSLNLPKSTAQLRIMIGVLEKHFETMGDRMQEVYVKSEVDLVLEDMALMAAIEDRAGEFWLKAGSHYVMDREKDTLWIYLPVAHAMYIKYVSTMTRKPATIDSGRQLAKLLHHENYYEGTKNIELNGRMAEMAQLSVSGLESKGVDVRHFENLNF